MYIDRTAERAIIEVAGSFPSIVVYGPRQVGKSTTVDHLFGTKYRRVTLDDVDDRSLAKNQPKLFLETYGWPLIIDEIQKVPELLDEIKKVIDEQRMVWLKTGEERKLMYILTGSNRFELQQGISDSLAGRCGVINLYSFSQTEKYQKKAQLSHPEIGELLKKEEGSYRNRRQIFEDIFLGGMPDVCTGISEREIYFKSYINTYIEKDVRKLIAASSEMQFHNFISLVALRTAQELHYDELAGYTGIDVRTCKKWLSVLETSGIIYLLQPYMANVSKRIIKAPKLYFMDTGLCAYLCKWPTAEMLENCAMNGAFFETYVVSELIKNLSAFNKEPGEMLYYYRDIDRKEVDLLFIEQNEIYPIEIKKGITPKKPTKNFQALEKYNLPIHPGLVIDSCERIRPIDEYAYSYPVHMLGM